MLPKLSGGGSSIDSLPSSILQEGGHFLGNLHKFSTAQTDVAPDSFPGPNGASAQLPN